MPNLYCEYFDIDEDYFPQINDSSIAAASPDFWMRTYPHQTFVDMLNSMERILSRQEKRSLWIEGAYGTGKSQCAYALKKILEVPKEELQSYWNRYEPLKKKIDLLGKFLGHKDKTIVTAYRYASGGINSSRDLFLAVQESIKASLIQQNLYTGENTLKESVIAWIDDPIHKQFMDALLKKPEWSSLFSQSNADEVLSALRKGGEVKKLMDSLFRLADKEGITALNIDADRLLAWLTDVIDQNNAKIVLIWDEFSDYFKNNRESLTEFQKLAELVSLKPFYFVVVTHESGQLFATADATWTKVRDRFVPVNIKLPDNIAFDLIGHAFTVKPAARDFWDEIADDLNSRVSKSRSMVMKAANITEHQVMKDIMPLHPMAALILKNIASAFKSNQRSMFDFIKSTNTEDAKAFQWFIRNAEPFDDHPLLTVDMLWNFFYEKGKENLTADIRLILDTFPQQQHLFEKEKTVLKTLLIMQAIDQRSGGTIDLIKATEQNLSYAFEGIPDLEGAACINIARQLVTKGILISNPIGGGKHAFAAAVLAGDSAKIESNKKDIREKSTTSKLVAEGNLSTVLSLSPALRLRFESEPNTGKITAVTAGDFTRTINALRNKATGWNFHAVIALAKDEMEAASFRKVVKAAAADGEYKDVVFIDALSTPLGLEAFEQYVEYSAMSMYYSGNQNNQARENNDKAKHVLDQDWKNRIYNGQFIVYTFENSEGEKFGNGQGVASILQTIVTSKYKYVFDFAKGLSENIMKASQLKSSAKCGIMKSTSGVVVGIEKHILPTVWNVDEKYWEAATTKNLPISAIKIEIEAIIEAAFGQDGQISIGAIYDHLEGKHGFAPSNLSAFLAGFLLKEYGAEPYRYSDSSGKHEPMTQEKLAEMLGNYIGGTPKPTYIVKMMAEEMAFYDVTEKAWRIAQNSCSSAGQAGIAVSAKMREFGLPVWCLAEVDDYGVYDVVQKYIELVQKEGNEAHIKAIEIGKVALIKTNLAESLVSLLTIENCQKGMLAFLKTFEEGKIIALANGIGAGGNVLSDIRQLFAVKHSSLWDKHIGEDEIRKLLTDYGIVKESNTLLNVTAHTLPEAYNSWREYLKFVGISHEALRAKFPDVVKVVELLYKIYQQQDILPEHRKTFLADLKANNVLLRDLLNNEKRIFNEVYAPYLQDFSESDIREIKSKLSMGMFQLSKTECNARVKAAADEFRKNQLKTQMFHIWKEKTGTKNPREWSNRYRTPILCCVGEREYGTAKKVFETLNRNLASDTDIKDAIAFLEKTTLFQLINDEAQRNAAFERAIVGKYRSLLLDPDKVREELERLSVDPYEWHENPSVRNIVKQLAEAEYNAGGSDKALTTIDKMEDSQLKKYLKRLVRENMTVGIEIIINGGA